MAAKTNERATAGPAWTRDGRKDEREGDRGPRLDPGRLAGENEDPGAYDDADAEYGQIHRSQLLAQRVRGCLGVTDRLLDRFGTPQVHPGLLAIGESAPTSRRARPGASTSSTLLAKP